MKITMKLSPHMNMIKNIYKCLKTCFCVSEVSTSRASPDILFLFRCLLHNNNSSSKILNVFMFPKNCTSDTDLLESVGASI